MKCVPARIAVLLAVVVAACASTDTVKESQGQGASRTYASAYDRVFDAATAAAKAKELDVVESDKRSGRLVLSHGITALSWGEHIAVFVKALTPDTTQVEVVSKPVLAPLNFPPDWQTILLDEIATELKK